MQRFEIELYSDTKTRPTPEMRRVIAEAEVGDEQHSEDPTVTALLEKIAPMLGHESALYLPAGTMANQIAVAIHCNSGDEIISHELGHIANYEGGGPSAIAGAGFRVVSGYRGTFTREAVREAIRPNNKYVPSSRLVVVEQTANIGGGTVWPLEQMQGVVEEAREHGLAVHMDGARLMNAAVASGRAPAEFSGMCDSVYLDFTKGLGAPLGAILAGSSEFIGKAWRWKQRLGGSMRQGGMMAAGCLYAIEHHVERLQEDHDNAKELGRLLDQIDGIVVEPIETNILFFDVAGVGVSAEAFNEALKPHSLRGGIHGPTRIRFVTHLDISKEMIVRAAQICGEVADKLRR